MSLKSNLKFFSVRTGRYFFLCLLFFTFSAEGSEAPFTFVAVGDTGCGCEPQFEVASQMARWHATKPFGIVLLLGDNIYGTRDGLPTSKRGGDPALFPERFDKPYAALLEKGIKFYAVLGNHDIETDMGRHEIKDVGRFNILGEYGYYSFSPADQVEFFGLNSNRLLGRGDEIQLEWLENALAKSKALWKIVFLHHSLIYSTEKARDPKPKRLEKILIDSGVKVVLAGHVHTYSRSDVRNGITYFISGGGGKDLIVGGTNAAASVSTYHFMSWDVFPDHLAFQTISSKGEILDSGVIQK